MNILSFDIEEWYIEKEFHGARKHKYIEFDKYLDDILNTLEELGIEATFFTLGKIAKEFPYVVKAIVDRGHELGCHSHRHMWLTKLSKKEALEDTKSAVDALQQCSGKRVKGYRAPAFSIGENNKWSFEVLKECGIEYDASVFPAERDFGGFPSFESDKPSIISYNGIEIKEFPIPLIKLLGKELVYSGGGYFRFFPLRYTESKMKSSEYTMTYFHIGDLISEQRKMMTREEYEVYFKENGSLVNRYKRYIKSNLGTSGAFDKLKSLLQSTDFISLRQADKLIDWENAGRYDLSDNVHHL